MDLFAELTAAQQGVAPGLDLALPGDQFAKGLRQVGALLRAELAALSGAQQVLLAVHRVRDGGLRCLRQRQYGADK
jgi:hypothetical protein